MAAAMAKRELEMTTADSLEFDWQSLESEDGAQDHYIVLAWAAYHALYGAKSGERS